MTDARKQRLDTLALADAQDIARLWPRLWQGCAEPAHETLRGPESGLVALDGRMGGGGAPFRFGEASVTRASVRLPDGRTGHAAALGRARDKVRVMALVDALCQGDAAMAARVEGEMIEPLVALAAARDRERAEETAATRVDFFTMVRGED